MAREEHTNAEVPRGAQPRFRFHSAGCEPPYNFDDLAKPLTNPVKRTSTICEGGRDSLKIPNWSNIVRKGSQTGQIQEVVTPLYGSRDPLRRESRPAFLGERSGK